ncbi:MAG: histidinol dehydrogenase [Chthonomonadales bacterium]
MRVVRVAGDGWPAAQRAVKRSIADVPASLVDTVRAIIADVRRRGDNALLELGRRFDAPGLAQLEVGEPEWDEACAALPPGDREVMDRAAASIERFHRNQVRTGWFQAEGGALVGQMVTPLERVGIYVPGGRAAYPSSVLMTAIPAAVAGVREIVVCTPARQDGTLPPTVLYAARAAGVCRVFKIGGAQAVAAMAFGTQSVPAVDKVVGPGNLYVNLAKKELWGLVDMDMLAGPSEVCIVADESARPAFVAADLLTQVEHDPDCAAFLFTPSESLLKEALVQMELQMEGLPRREILRQAMEANGVAVVTDTLEEAVELANLCAPEHLALMVRDPLHLLGFIRNAGAVLLGDYSPQTLGDYFAGPSHTLPTGGTARFASPLNVDTFVKKTSVIAYSAQALAGCAENLTHFARLEGFEAHARAVEHRQGGAEPRDI